MVEEFCSGEWAVLNKQGNVICLVLPEPDVRCEGATVEDQPKSGDKMRKGNMRRKNERGC